MNKEEILQKKKHTLFKHFKLKRINLCFAYEYLTSKIILKKKNYVRSNRYAAIKNSDTNTDVVNTSITAFVCN